VSVTPTDAGDIRNRLQAGGREVELRVIGGNGSHNRGFRQSSFRHFHYIGIGQRIFLLGGQGGYSEKNNHSDAGQFPHSLQPPPLKPSD